MNLPLFHEVIASEVMLNDKIFYSLRYFMDEGEFSVWDAKVKKVIPWFYLLMSIWDDCMTILVIVLQENGTKLPWNDIRKTIL